MHLDRYLVRVHLYEPKRSDMVGMDQGRKPVTWELVHYSGEKMRPTY